MLNIRPVSDLRNKFTEIEETVKRGQPVYLTKNGYGSMVVMSLEQYSALTENVEAKLDEADRAAAARLVGDGHRLSDELKLAEGLRDEAYRRIPAAARAGRRDELERLRRIAVRSRGREGEYRDEQCR